MATYDELLTIATTASGATLRNRVQIAVIVSADTIRQEPTATTNHVNRLKWAQQALNDPGSTAERMLWATLAQNRTFSAAQITGASDAAIQTAVDAAVDLLAQG